MSLLGQYEYVIDKTHHRANKDGAVYKHIIIAEEKIGRPLLDEEFVHHKDLNKLNNHPDNLMIFASNSDHTRFHMYKLDETKIYLNENGAYVCPYIPKRCIDCGTVITHKGIRCVTCSYIYLRKTKRPDWLELLCELFHNKGNFTKIAKQYGVTDNTVRKWCKSYGLNCKSSQYK